MCVLFCIYILISWGIPNLNGSYFFRMGGEDAEIRFCEHKRLNMPTLRMTWEAKVQLKDILVNVGFPEG